MPGFLIFSCFSFLTIIFQILSIQEVAVHRNMNTLCKLIFLFCFRKNVPIKTCLYFVLLNSNKLGNQIIYKLYTTMLAITLLTFPLIIHLFISCTYKMSLFFLYVKSNYFQFKWLIIIFLGFFYYIVECNILKFLYFNNLH